MLLPASALMDLAVLNLQRQGRLSLLERWGWIAAWLVVISGLAMAVWTDGNNIRQLTDRVLHVEIVMGFVYAAMQMYYSILQFRELERMQAVIENYFDRDRKGLTTWMKYAIAVNGLLAIFVPLLIFGPNMLVGIFALSFFWGIFMMWFSFVRYFTSNDMKRVREAEASAEDTTKAECASSFSDEDKARVSRAVDRWLATGAHLKSGITSPVAADAMNIPRYQLTAWVKASGHTSFTRWITTLRIDEAKRVIKAHRDWNNEAVADHCGFSRTHFQKIFKQETGMSPTEFVDTI